MNMFEHSLITKHQLKKYYRRELGPRKDERLYVSFLYAKEFDLRKVESKTSVLLRHWRTTNSSPNFECKNNTSNLSSFLDPDSLL